MTSFFRTIGPIGARTGTVFVY